MNDFNDWANPTTDEIKLWAYDQNALAPEQDFNLMVAQPGYMAELLDLAADANCPKRNFFLQTLYIYAGDTIKGKNQMRLKLLEDLLRKGQTYKDDLINIWIKRVNTLKETPNQLNYSDWYENPKLTGVGHW